MQALKTHIGKGLTVIGGNVGNAVITLVRIKLLAIFFGPAGVGWINLTSNLIEIVAAICGQGWAGVLNRELPRSDEQRQKDLFSTAVGVLLVFVALAIVPAILCLVWVSDVPGMSGWHLLFFALLLLVSSMWRLISSLHFGLGLSTRMFWVMLGAGFSALALTALLGTLGLRDYLVFAAIPPAFLVICGSISVARRISRLVSWREVVAMSDRRLMLGMGLPILLSVLIEPLMLYYLRVATSQRLGEVEVGLLQPGLQFMLLGTMVFSSFCGITILRWDQSVEHGASRRMALLLGAACAMPIVVAIFAVVAEPLFDFAIHLIFTKEFASAIDAVPWLLAAEGCRMGAFLLTTTFYSVGRSNWTVWPRFAALGVLVVAIETHLHDSIVEIAQGLLLGNGVFFATSLAMWLFLQYNARSIPLGRKGH